MLLLSGTAGLQDANANGDTRTLHLFHEHTKESASITYRHDGRYVSDGLRQLNWLLRDWRIDEQIAMDPKLFDIIWQVYREAGARGPIHVNSAYRSPQTNAALRRRSRGVAQFSQHMRGKALDFFLEGVSMARVREIGLKLQQGGVGFYPHSRHQFVHLDAGGVRSWPRLPDAHLARLFPDGRTVHIPASGQPMARYEEARSAILARGGTVGSYTAYAEEGSGPRPKSFWARLFGGGEDEDEDLAAPGMGGSRSQYASAGMNDADGGSRGFFSFFGGSSPAREPAPAPAAAEPPPEPVTTTASLPPPGRPGPAATPAPLPVLAAPIAVPMPPRRPVELAIVAKESPARVAAIVPPPRTDRRAEERSAGRGSAGASKPGSGQRGDLKVSDARTGAAKSSDVRAGSAAKKGDARPGSAKAEAARPTPSKGADKPPSRALARRGEIPNAKNAKAEKVASAKAEKPRTAPANSRASASRLARR